MFVFLPLSVLLFSAAFIFPQISFLNLIALAGIIAWAWNTGRKFTVRRCFVVFLLCGFISYLLIINWLRYVTVPGFIALSFYMAVYWGLFGLLVFVSRNLRHRAVFVSLGWVLLEYLRSVLFGGFGWALLGYSVFNQQYLIQPAEFAGAYGISFLIVFCNSALAEFIVSKKKGCLIAAVVLLTGSFTYSTITLHSQKAKALLNEGTPLKITVFQPNIPQEVKWDESKAAYIKASFSSRLPVLNATKADMVIFPESSWPDIGEGINGELISFAEKMPAHFLIGLIVQDSNEYHNAAYLFDRGRPKGFYYKLRLVPFGEYVPLRKFFTWVDILNSLEDMAPGKKFTVFEAGGKKFSVLICFEDVFSDLSTKFVREGAEFLVNITNDAWFGKSVEPVQHLSASVFRAIENRKYIVRSANTGISGFIDPYGKTELLENGKIFVSGILTQSVYPNQVKTFYTRFGDYLFWAYLLPFLVLFVTLFIFRRKKTTHNSTA